VFEGKTRRRKNGDFVFNGKDKILEWRGE